ncbi:MAG TPA: protein kinase [Bryobacteraceae bacterium]
MTRCKSCDAEIQPVSRFCPSCGTPATVGAPEETETIAMDAAPASNGRGAAPARAFEKSLFDKSGERFAPGALIASRYRIVSRLGQGGMGEVFRADDLVLGQPVALKFLPEAAHGNVNLLTRFYDEVRIARQIAHKNVCRVYDIGEIGGQPYLSMEYIDGEDLAGLLRRIGRLPGDKALEFARKLCAGLAAAHAQGILHRDLKPANIMVDSRGEVRITDFGLAAIAQQLQNAGDGAEIRNGTPAYMAPEQLAGREVSAQSDIYALGLVLYEMFTGKQPFEAGTLAEMTRLREGSRLTNPSTLVPELDKTAERAILRCLEGDPRNRPSSALALAAMLPGGDPLAEALAAGETPSPEMVANAGSDEGLSLKVSIPTLAGIAAILIAFCIWYPKTQLLNRIPLENSPEVLAAKARDLARSFGFTDRPADTAGGFLIDGDNLQYMQRLKTRGNEAWTRVLGAPPSPLFFWYRQSPAPMAALNLTSYATVNPGDPPMTTSGMVYIALEPDGRLKWLRATPPQFETSGNGDAPADWKPFFAAAHLDPEQFQPDQPRWAPLAATDNRFAWTGAYPGRPEIKVRVEAASFHGRPVLFETFWPWTQPRRAPASSGLTSAELSNLLTATLTAIFGITACFFARYNWKAGRGDMRGAIRIGAYIASIGFLAWILQSHHVSTPAEKELLGQEVANAVFDGFVYWVVYLALEPWVRRYWPQTLISWSRLLAGRLRDPMIGRDILFSVLFGLVYALLVMGLRIIVIRVGLPPLQGHILYDLMGTRMLAGNLVQQLHNAILDALQVFLALFVLRAVLRKQWLAAVAFVLIFGAIDLYGDIHEIWYILVPLYVAIYVTLVAIMLRFGLLATVLTLLVLRLANAHFLTTDFSAWYGESSAVVVAVLIALALWGFKLSLGRGTPAGKQLVSAA